MNFDRETLRTELRDIAKRAEAVAAKHGDVLSPFTLQQIATAIGALHSAAGMIPDYFPLPPFPKSAWEEG